MSRKHFRAIASALFNLDISAESKKIVAHAIADELVHFNSNFKYDTFIDACLDG